MSELKLDYEVLPFGAMVWWDKCENAACYNVRLSIIDDGEPHEICQITKDRNTRYHSFVDLGRNKMGYTVRVQAEDREGKVIWEQSLNFTVTGTVRISGVDEIVTVREPYVRF